MFNYYLVKTKGKYLNTDNDKPSLVDRKIATRYSDEFSADYMGYMYCDKFEIEIESFDS